MMESPANTSRRFIAVAQNVNRICNVNCDIWFHWSNNQVL